MDVVQVLWQAVSLALGAARVAFRDTLVAVKARARGEPPVVGANCLDSVAARAIKRRSENVSAAVDVVLNRVLARLLAVLAVGGIALHKTRRRAALIGVAGGLLHSEEGQDSRINVVLFARGLKLCVVLLAALANALVVVLETDVGEFVDVEEGRLPAIAGEASVEPGLRAIGATSIRTTLGSSTSTLGVGVCGSLASRSSGGKADDHGGRSEVCGRVHDSGSVWYVVRMRICLIILIMRNPTLLVGGKRQSYSRSYSLHQKSIESTDRRVGTCTSGGRLISKRAKIFRGYFLYGASNRGGRQTALTLPIVKEYRAI